MSSKDKKLKTETGIKPKGDLDENRLIVLTNNMNYTIFVTLKDGPNGTIGNTIIVAPKQIVRGIKYKHVNVYNLPKGIQWYFQ